MSPALRAFNDEADELEARLVKLRESLTSLNPYSSPEYQEIRALRKQLSAHDAECARRFALENPEWAKFWLPSSD